MQIEVALCQKKEFIINAEQLGAEADVEHDCCDPSVGLKLDLLPRYWD